MARDPRYQTDPVHHLSTEQLRQFLAALYRALANEYVDDALQTRIVNRVVYGNPQGIPADALAVLQQTPYRFRSPGTDGLGPLMPGDVVREHVPVRLEGPMSPDLREKILGSLGGLTDEKQARWLAEGGEQRHHTGGPPPNAAAEPDAAAAYRASRYYETVIGDRPLTPEDREKISDLLDPPYWRRALRRLRGGR